MADQTVIKADDLVVTGNLKVSGSQISTTSTDTEIKDSIITLNKGGTLTASGSGIAVESGGSTVANLVYKSSGWDLGSKNITTTGTISGVFNLATDSVNDTHIDFGTGTNQVNTDDLPEGSTNIYYTDARFNSAFDTRLGLKSTDNLTEGTNLYYTDTRFDTRLSSRTTDNLSEGSSNLYYTNSRVTSHLGTLNTANLPEGTNLYFTNARADARADVRIAASSIDALSDVNTSGASNGKILMYDGTNFVMKAVPMATTETVKSGTGTSGALTITDQSFGTSSATSHRVGGSININVITGGFVQISFTGSILQDSASTTSFALQKSINGGTSFSNLPEAIYQSNQAGYPQTFTYLDNHLTATASVEYRVVAKTTSANPSVTLEVENINFSAIEFKVGEYGALDNLSDVAITSQQAGQILYANSGSSWINQIPTISLNSDVDTTSTAAPTNLLRYDGASSSWKGATPQAVASTIQLGYLSDVNTSGIASGSILKYDGSNWIISSGFEELTQVVEDTTPQLGGDLDVNGNNITGSAVSITTSSAGNITLDPDGAGEILLQGTTKINGNLTVTGSATTMDVTNIEVEDSVMVLNKQTPQPANNSMDAGIMIQRGSSENNTSWYWDEDTDRWKAVLTTTSNIDSGVTGVMTKVDTFGAADASRTAGTYNGVTGTSTGSGTVGTFNITVDASTGAVSSVIIVTGGTGHAVDDTITVQDSALGGGGAANFTFDVADIDDIADTSFADIQAGTAHLTATQALYADLAEIYESDADYEPGTVLIIGGEKEVTQCKMLQDPRVVGVVSTNPAYLMNKDGSGVAVALRGKVPCKVEGPVRKGDVLVTNVTPGTATTLTDDSPTPPGFCVIGKSLETNNEQGIKLVNIVV